jgi:selenide, water dikinase
MTTTPTQPRRFIDFSDHGGCSRKVNGIRLAHLLEPLDLPELWADAGTIDVTDMKMASSVDIVLPMIDDPALFGRIVVAHVLSDLYACGAEPLFGLNILALPPGNPGGDDAIREMLVEAAAALRDSGAVLLGGHSIENDQLMFGLAAAGRTVGAGLSPSGARCGDALVLTKPLGTSIASMLWQARGYQVATFQDVVDGMTATNAKAARLLRRARARACTDVTGYGFLGHLHNMLVASGVAARVNAGDLPRYASTVPVAGELAGGTRLLDFNEDFVMGDVRWTNAHNDPTTRAYLYDAQVSGGLLAAVPSERLNDLAAEAAVLDLPYWVVGEIREGPAGEIEL